MALTTLANAKMQLSIPSGVTLSDAKLNLYIAAATEFLKSYTDRATLEAASVTEFQDGARQNIILLREYPVNSVTELRFDSGHLFTDPATLVASTEYGVTDDSNSIVYYTGSIPAGFRNLKIIYNAGYATIPADLELVALWCVEWFFLHNERKDMGRTSMGKGDENVGILADMPPMIRTLANLYQRVEAPIANSMMRRL